MPSLAHERNFRVDRKKNTCCVAVITLVGFVLFLF